MSLLNAARVCCALSSNDWNGHIDNPHKITYRHAAQKPFTQLETRQRNTRSFENIEYKWITSRSKACHTDILTGWSRTASVPDQVQHSLLSLSKLVIVQKAEKCDFSVCGYVSGLCRVKPFLIILFYLMLRDMLCHHSEICCCIYEMVFRTHNSIYEY